MPTTSHTVQPLRPVLNGEDPVLSTGAQSISFLGLKDMTTNPTVVQGAWTRGWALDRHITSSVFLGDDEYGHARFESTRSPIGELLYQLKYRNQQTAGQIADVMKEFFDDKPNTLGRIDLVVPDASIDAPPSSARCAGRGCDREEA